MFYIIERDKQGFVAGFLQVEVPETHSFLPEPWDKKEDAEEVLNELKKHEPGTTYEIVEL